MIMTPKCTILFLLIAAATVSHVLAQSITSLTLVNTNTGQDLIEFIDDTVIYFINLYETNPPLSIRADVSGGSDSISFVEFDFDQGRVIRQDGEAPYYLGGDIDGSPNAVASLEELGMHTLTVKTISFLTGETTDEITIMFLVLDSDTEDFPTMAPTIPNYDVKPYGIDVNGALNGELKLWHKITLGFSGFPTAEDTIVENPFTDYRLDVNFTHQESGTIFIVPGFYAADGNAANSGARSGSEWLCHFVPNQIGEWTWRASFTEGEYAAAYGNGTSASFFDNASGSFSVADSDKSEPDLRAYKGRLNYVGERYLQFEDSNEYFLKIGAASPENIFAYEDFDNTPNNNGYLKTWNPHKRDYILGNPTWSGGKGTGLIGAINYLSNIGLNALTIQTMTLFGPYGGDDGNVFPFITDDDFVHYDVSKLSQWEVVMDHATNMGLHIQIRTQEQENDQLLDGGALGVARRVYYRELVARFGHNLALTWNLGEENTNSETERKQFSDYIRSIDPYNHPIVLHAFSSGKEDTYNQLLNYPSFDGASLQTRPENTVRETSMWVDKSSQSGKNWIVSIDEQNPNTIGVVPDTIDPTHDIMRKQVLWGSVMVGGAGVEWYFGYKFANSDLTCENFRPREAMFKQSRYMTEFFERNNVMINRFDKANDLITEEGQALANRDFSEFIVYLPNGGTNAQLDLSAQSGGTFISRWYNPRQGGDLIESEVGALPGGFTAFLGTPPSDTDQDWVVLIRCIDCDQAAEARMYKEFLTQNYGDTSSTGSNTTAVTPAAVPPDFPTSAPAFGVYANHVPTV